MALTAYTVIARDGLSIGDKNYKNGATLFLNDKQAKYLLLNRSIAARGADPINPAPPPNPVPVTETNTTVDLTVSGQGQAVTIENLINLFPRLQPQAGAKGDRGEKGERGSIGPRGPVGDEGPQGPPGPKGADASFVLKGALPSYTDLTAIEDPVEGDAYLIDRVIWVLTGSSWQSGGQVQGVPGAQGDEGPQGERGLQGFPGEKGDKGNPGEKGDRGDKGDKGDKGDTGAPGATAVSALTDATDAFRALNVRDPANQRLAMGAASAAALLSLSESTQTALTGKLDAVILGIARADIASRTIPVTAFRVSGFSARGDFGSGATYTLGTSAGPMAIKDAAGTWFQLDLSEPFMQASWFGVAPGILTAAQGEKNRVGLNVAKRYLTTGRTLFTPAGKIALSPDPASLTDPQRAGEPAWDLADGTKTSIATTAGWSVQPAGGFSTPAGGELGGPGGTEFVAVGAWGSGPMIRVNGPTVGLKLRISANGSGIAATGVDLIHLFRSRIDIEVQQYTVNGAVLRTIDGPNFSGLTQGFMECEGRINATLPATRTAEGVVLKACESPLAKADPGYFYQGFSRNKLRIKAEIPGAKDRGAIVIDRIDNNTLPMMFTYAGGNGADAGSGGIRFVPSNDGFFPCENNFFGSHILGGMIGTPGWGGNMGLAFSTSDGEQIPPEAFGPFLTYTGLFGNLKHIYGTADGTQASPTYTFSSQQGTGAFPVPGGGYGIAVNGVLGAQWDGSGRMGAGMAPVAGYGLSVLGDVNLSGGSRTIGSTSGSFIQLQAPTLIYLTTAGAQQVAVDASGLYPMVNNGRDLGKGASQQWRNLYLQNAPTINSDAKLKDEIEEIPESVLRAVLTVPIRRYKLKQSIAEKGSSKARWHVGVIAQDVIAAFKAAGEDAFAWSLICEDADTEIVFVTVEDPEAEGGERVELETRPVIGPDGKQTSTLSVRYDEWQNLVLAAISFARSVTAA